MLFLNLRVCVNVGIIKFSKRPAHPPIQQQQFTLIVKRRRGARKRTINTEMHRRFCTPNLHNDEPNVETTSHKGVGQCFLDIISKKTREAGDWREQIRKEMLHKLEPTKIGAPNHK